MKTKILILTALLIAAVINAANIGLEWDPSPEPDIRGYIMYWGLVAQSTTTNRADILNVPRGALQTAWIDAPLSTVDLNGLPAGHYFFFVTAISLAGAESDASNIVIASLPGAPKNNRIK